MQFIETYQDGPVRVITINRIEVRNAVNRQCADELAEAFRNFEQDSSSNVAVLGGEGGTFCAGADLKAIAGSQLNRLVETGDGPMGPSRMVLSKPVIAAIDGYAVAGGLELALLCDLRVMEEDAVIGVFCRRFGVPLMDGGTIRLPRIIGLGRALDLILTGRAVDSAEALAIGLANRVVKKGSARQVAIELAKQIASFPEVCMLEDRASIYESLDLAFDDAIRNEFRHGMRSISAGTVDGAKIFAQGNGRHGTFQ